eukprot:164291_1
MDQSIARLMNMGFEFDIAIHALEASNNNESLALQYLIEGFPDSSSTMKPKKSKSKSKPFQSQTESVISWVDGHDKIYNKGIKPFFDRIETAFGDTNQKLAKKHLIPQEIYMYCYDLIFTMCIQRDPCNYSASLYGLHSTSLTTYFSDVILVQLDTCRANVKYGHNDIQYIECFITSHKKCMIAIKGLHTIFHYLNRFYVPNTENTMTIDMSGLLIYFDSIFTLHSKYVIHIVFKYIELCRDYKVLNHSSFDIDCNYYKIKQFIFEYANIVSFLNKGLSKDKTGNVDAIRRADNVKTSALLPYGFMHEITGIYSLYIPTVITQLILSYYDGVDALSIHEQYFLKIMQAETHRYYNNKCTQMIKKGVTMTEYVKKAEQCMEYETNQGYGEISDMRHVVRQIFYNEDTVLRVWRSNAINGHSSLVNIHKYAMDSFTLLTTVKGNYCVCQLVIDSIKDDVNQVFKYYVANAKKNVRSKDIYVKYQLMYDGCYLYKEITDRFYSYRDNMRFKSMICNEFYKLCAQLIGSELDFMCDLLAKFSNYILRNSHRISYEIETMMEFVAFVYKLMYFVAPNCCLFLNKYKYYWIKRLKRQRLSGKRFYFEYKMIRKLHGKQLPKWMREIVQTGGHLKLYCMNMER